MSVRGQFQFLEGSQWPPFNIGDNCLGQIIIPEQLLKNLCDRLALIEPHSRIQGGSVLPNLYGQKNDADDHANIREYANKLCEIDLLHFSFSATPQRSTNGSFRQYVLRGLLPTAHDLFPNVALGHLANILIDHRHEVGVIGYFDLAPPHAMTLGGQN